jgi:phage-related tail protein
MAETEKPKGSTLSVSQVATLCGRSTQWVQQLVKSGFIEKQAHNKYTLVSVIRGVIAYYEDLQTKNSKAATATRASEARTRQIELKIKKESRELIPLEDAKAELADWTSAVRSEFQGLPARYTRDMQERRRLEQEIDGSFDRLSRRTSEAERALETGEGVTSPE